MARLARVVVPHVPHHVTQRGNRRERTFFEDADYKRLSSEFDMAPALLDPAGYKAYAQAQFVREKTMLDEIGFKPE